MWQPWDLNQHPNQHIDEQINAVNITKKISVKKQEISHASGEIGRMRYFTSGNSGTAGSRLFIAHTQAILTSILARLYTKIRKGVNMEPVVLVHGGAGIISDDETAKKLIAGVKKAAVGGYMALKDTGCILDAVEVAVRYLEDDENFNAGKGSVVNLDGEVEMDASIMLGSDLSAGAVTIVKDVKNPITLARSIMENTEHVLLGAEGAKRFAIEQGLEMVPPGAMVTKRRMDDMVRIKREKLSGKPELGTVGAVAVDSSGKVAAATSTGGREGKMVGRCSDTSVIGSGTYADDKIGAVSTTGHGETIMRFCLAYEILNTMEKGSDAQSATTDAIARMTEKLNNTAGAITISNNGDVGIGFSTRRMSWAYVKAGRLYYGIDPGQHESEPFNF